RRMILNSSGQLWCSNYGWLHDYFARTSGDGSYIWNGTGAQSANFNITGHGTIGTELYVNNWIRKPDNDGIYWSGNGWHIYPANGSDMRMRTGGSNGGIMGMTAGDIRGYVHWTTSNEIGFLNSGRGWSLRVDNSGNTFATSSSRAPIFYDSNHTGYYANPYGDSYFRSLRMPNGGSQRFADGGVAAYVLQADYWYDHDGSGSMYAGEPGNDVRFRGTMHLGDATSDYKYFQGQFYPETQSDSHRYLGARTTSSYGYGYCGTSSKWFYYVYSHYLRYKSSVGSFDTYDDLALLDNMVSVTDTVWDPILQNHFVIGKEENMPQCITNYGERASNPDVGQFIDVAKSIGLAYGASRQLNRETKARDERLVARTDILADAIGVNFSGNQKGGVTRKIFDFGTSKMNDDEVRVEFTDDFASQLDEDYIPVVIITPTSPNAGFYVAEKNNRGFKIIRMSGDGEFSFDWSAFARVEVEVAGSDIDHIDDVFYRPSFDLPRGDYKEFVPYIGELKDTITTYDPNKVYPVDMEQILKDSEERRLQEEIIRKKSITPADTYKNDNTVEEHVPPTDNYVPATDPAQEKSGSNIAPGAVQPNELSGNENSAPDAE
ncbi:hypothetical protein KAH81_06985, partial [bacterium]|nr:hypothetical protein [bacterium]